MWISNFLNGCKKIKQFHKLDQNNLRIGFVGAAALAAAGNAMASTSGSMPWDSWLTTLSNDLTGPTAAVVGTLFFFAAGAMLIFGREEMHGFVKTLLYGIMGIAVLVNGPNIMQTLGANQGALIF